MVTLIVACGMVAGAGLALLIREYVPRQPHPGDAIARLTGAAPTYTVAATDGSVADRLGRRMAAVAGTWTALRIPHNDLELLRIPVTRFIGEKIIFAFIGLATPAAAAASMSVFGTAPPVAIPSVAGLVLAVVASYVPNYNVAEQARTARAEFDRTMTSYVDLVAMDLAAGVGLHQAMHDAAHVADSWVFHRLRHELARAELNDRQPWDALRAVGEDLRLPSLTKTATVVALAGNKGASIVDVLRDRATGMRDEQLNLDKARAGARTERATVPVSMTTIVFLTILIVPMITQTV
ncbi:type II secretion system F family protein [Phytoactinopolyspora halotolerans]|uniref:Type II secretion system F family protein n=1 Tax=Phytoactinopolyspora halotolerans TaxID=1981512 RepID=A0A6L9S988_9ACTN|nr:type II secretion system F family protein [Phytoactinopolyspora halotolerans]NEE01174.1 type II secretion system F family protein [Phytoactinopolyspora halotolerans]